MTALKYYDTETGTWKTISSIQGPPGPVASIPQEAWRVPALTSPWQNMGGAKTPASFKRSPDGVVRLRGTVGPNGAASGSQVFQLPADCCPTAEHRFALYAYTTGASTAALVVYPSGGLQILWSGTAPAEVALDGVEFDTATAASTWPAGAAQPILLVTALPATPVSGHEVYFQNAAMATQGVIWHLRYNGVKWDFLGGAEMYSQVVTAQSPGTASGWVDLATVGPTLTLPVAGDYRVAFGARMDMPGTVRNASVGLHINGALAEYVGVAAPSSAPVNGWTDALLTGRAKDDVLKLMYYSTGTDSPFTNRRLSVRPVRLG